MMEEERVGKSILDALLYLWREGGEGHDLDVFLICMSKNFFCQIFVSRMITLLKG